MTFTSLISIISSFISLLPSSTLSTKRVSSEQEKHTQKLKKEHLVRSNRNKMEALIKGQKFTNQLQLLLLQNMTSIFGDGVFEESALELSTKIHQSFADALSLLSLSTANQYSGNGGTISDDELLLIHDHESTLSPVVTGISSFSNSDDLKSSVDSKAIPDSSTDRKIGFKRRKTSHTWVKVTPTPTPIDDGHAWRKYGQKLIHNNKFPRSYYRCSYKKEQDCEATKQVQKTQDKPSMYQTTYKGPHTCKDTTISHLDDISDFMLDESDSACVINFQTNITTKQPTYTSSSSFNTSVKKHDQLIKHNTETHDQEYHPALKNVTPSIDNDLTISEFLILADLSTFDSISREVLEVMGFQQTSL